MLLERIMIQAIWFTGDFSRHYFIISLSGRASSFLAYQNFSKGAISQHIFHQITTPPLASSRHPRPKYRIRDYTQGRKLKIKAFQVYLARV